MYPTCLSFIALRVYLHLKLVWGPNFWLCAFCFWKDFRNISRTWPNFQILSLLLHILCSGIVLVEVNNVFEPWICFAVSAFILICCKSAQHILINVSLNNVSYIDSCVYIVYEVYTCTLYTPLLLASSTNHIGGIKDQRVSPPSENIISLLIRLVLSVFVFVNCDPVKVDAGHLDKIFQ